MKKIAAIALGIIFLASCSTSNEVTSNKLFQKRKYKKGWHINSSKSFDKSSKGKKNEEIAVVDNKKTFTTKESSIQATTEEISPINPVISNNQVVTPNIVPSSSIEEAVNSIQSKENNTAVEVESFVENTVNNEDALLINEASLDVDYIKSVTNEESSNKSSDDDMLILLYILAILIPFVAVGIVTDWDIKKVLINLLLCFLCYIPGVIHAFITIRDYK